ncbi:MAG: glycosyltransferase [Caldilineaceae bacterium]
MRFLFVSAQLPGHLDWGGYLPTAAALVQQGHDVLWATGAEMQAAVAARACPYTSSRKRDGAGRHPLLRPTDVDSPETFRRLRMARSLDQWLAQDRVGAATQEITELGRSFAPDLIGAEMFMAGAGIAAEVLDVPFVVMGWPALRTPFHGPAQEVADEAQRRIDGLLSQFAAAGVNWEKHGPPALLSPHLHLTYWSPRWYSGLPLLEQTVMVGGVAPDPQPWKSPWLNQLPMDQPWIFITLGTSFSQDVNFFVAAAHAAHQVGGLPVLAIGDQLTQPMMSQLQAKLPKGTVVTARVDFGEVLPYAAAAIHHGGAGTTHALVTHGVPQIIVPHAADQSRQAEGLAQRRRLPHPPREMTIPLLVQSLKNMLPHDSAIRRNARSLREEFAALGGVPRAAEVLVSLVERLKN